MSRGAAEMVVVAFAGAQVEPSAAIALREQVPGAAIAIIDLLFLRKELDGTVRSFELEEVVQDDRYAEFNGIAQEIGELIAPDDVIEIAGALVPGTSAMIVLFEHTWLRGLRGAVEDGGGAVVLAERIPAAVVDEVERGVSDHGPSR